MVDYGHGVSIVQRGYTRGYVQYLRCVHCFWTVFEGVFPFLQGLWSVRK